MLGILANPSYAGTYVFGRYQSCKQVGPSGEISTRSRPVPQEAWRVTIRDHHEGYINWDEFVANRRRLASNRTNGEQLAGPAREGLCLLQGLLVCGVCGGAGRALYRQRWHLPDISMRLEAPRGAGSAGLPLGPSGSARSVDYRTAAGAITPVTIELALAALTSLEQRDHEIGAQWRMRIERARYEADLAERRYQAVDPANRLIAATLEQRWNDAIQRLQDLEAQLGSLRTTDHARRDSRAEATDPATRRRLPQLWAASTTTERDRKRILRLLVRDITVTRGPEPKAVKLHVCWQGGATETLELRLPPNRAEAVRYPEGFVTRIRELAISHHDDFIIRLLHAEGHRSSTGKSLTPSMIKWLRYKHRIPAPQPPDDTLNVRQVRDKYGVSLWVVHYWIGRGLVVAHQRKPNAPYAISIDDKSDQFLRNLGCQVQYIYTRHPKRTLHEVHYARKVEMPNGLSLPLAFGINTRLIGFGR